MNLFRLHRLLDENNGEGNDLGGGTGGTNDTHVDDAGGAGTDDENGTKKDEPAKPVTVEAMSEAITKGLANGGTAIDEPKVVKQAADVVVKKDDGTVDEVATKAAKDEATRRAALPEDERKKLIEQDRQAELAKKKPDDFKLPEAEAKALGAKAHARFQDLTAFARTHYDRAERASAQATQFKKTYDDMVDTFTKAKASADDLVNLLDLNFKIKSGDHEGALKVINATRADLLKALGREEPGVDLLAEFPDLKNKVEANELTREDALKLAAAERTRIANENGRRQQHEIAQTNQQIEEKRTTALNGIDAWCKEMAGKDIDFKAKEARIVNQINDIIANYEPHLWLPTIQKLYATVTVVKTKLPNTPTLRPNNGGGGKPAPTDMMAAIAGGLGYANMTSN